MKMKRDADQIRLGTTTLNHSSRNSRTKHKKRKEGESVSQFFVIPPLVILCFRLHSTPLHLFHLFYKFKTKLTLGSGVFENCVSK